MYLTGSFYKMYTAKHTQLKVDQQSSSSNYGICCDSIVFSNIDARRWRQCVKHGIVKLK